MASLNFLSVVSIVSVYTVDFSQLPFSYFTRSQFISLASFTFPFNCLERSRVIPLASFKFLPVVSIGLVLCRWLLSTSFQLLWLVSFYTVGLFQLPLSYLEQSRFVSLVSFNFPLLVHSFTAGVGLYCFPLFTLVLSLLNNYNIIFLFLSSPLSPFLPFSFTLFRLFILHAF